MRIAKSLKIKMVSKALAERIANQYKAESDTLIDDIAVLKANISRLERENEKQLDLLEDFKIFIDYKLEIHKDSYIYRRYKRKLEKLGVK